MTSTYLFFFALLLACNFHCGAEKCRSTQFSCKNGRGCIHKSWKCDGEKDCMDGSDERGCKKVKCTPLQFTCRSRKCISKSERCDGINHCGDNSDEVGCPSLPSFACNQEGAFRCTGTNTCIDGIKVCDKRNDCLNGDDESSACGVNECLVSKGGCSQKCIDLKIGFKCGCNNGYVLNADGKTCSDIDECNTHGRCDQMCENTPGSYNCNCSSDYTLEKDGRSCKAKGIRPTLIIANLVDISQFSMDGKESNRLVYGEVMGGSLAMDVNPHDGYIYWADYVKGTISRVHMNNTKDTAIIANGKLTRAEGVAIDWIGQNLYWTNAGEATIEVSDVNGRYRKTLFDSGLEMPRGIAVAPAKRLLFWTDWGNHPKIERSSMDGANRKTIIGADTLKWPNAVTVDQVLHRLYWVDSGNGFIGSSNLDGADVRKIITSSTGSSFGLTVFEGYVFWTQNRGKVYKANKFDGEDKREIRGAYFKPYTIEVNHVAAKPEGKNPCGKQNGGCEQLCLLSTLVDQGYSCACKNGFVLEGNKKSCSRN